MGQRPYVIDIRESDFEEKILAQSHTVPVVLDLWATWSGPCQTLSPILEALAADYGGRFLLAKVDVDAEQRIAAAFQVQNIPSVFAVIAGQPIPLFQGALTEPQVRQYLDELLKAAAQAGVTGRLPEAAAFIRPIRPGEQQVSAPVHASPSPPVSPTMPQPQSGDADTATKLFVSHATEDGQVAQDIVAELSAQGIGTWLATRDIQVGENYAAQIYTAIVESSHLLVLLSPASVASQHVQREMNLALDQHKVILPLLATGDTDFMSSLPAEWKYWLGVVQVAPYTEAKQAVSTLLRRIAT